MWSTPEILRKNGPTQLSQSRTSIAKTPEPA
jgi:hypothetical protein